MDGVDRATADRVVRLVLQEGAPRAVDGRSFVVEPERATQRGPGLRPRRQQLLDGAVAQLERHTRRPHARKKIRRARPDERVPPFGKCAGGGERRDRVVEQCPLRPDLLGDRSRRRVGRHVVEAVHQQHRSDTGACQPVDDTLEPLHGTRHVVVGIEARGAEVPLAEIPGTYLAAVG